MRIHGFNFEYINCLAAHGDVMGPPPPRTPQVDLDVSDNLEIIRYQLKSVQDVCNAKHVNHLTL